MPGAMWHALGKTGIWNATKSVSRSKVARKRDLLLWMFTQYLANRRNNRCRVGALFGRAIESLAQAGPARASLARVGRLEAGTHKQGWCVPIFLLSDFDAPVCVGGKGPLGGQPLGRDIGQIGAKVVGVGSIQEHLVAIAAIAHVVV